jgi:hypothetical protein
VGLEEGARGKSAHDHLHGHHAAAQRPVTDTQHRTHTHTHTQHRTHDTRKEGVSCLGEEGRSARERLAHRKLSGPSWPRKWVGRPLSWSSRNTPHVVSFDSRPLPSITSLCAHARESRPGQWR